MSPLERNGGRLVGALPFLFLLGAATVATLLPDAFLLTREALEAGQVWRLWTGHLVHARMYGWSVSGYNLQRLLNFLLGFDTSWLFLCCIHNSILVLVNFPYILFPTHIRSSTKIFPASAFP